MSVLSVYLAVFLEFRSCWALHDGQELQSLNIFCFSCQLKVQAPANHFIVLNVKDLNTSHRHNSQIAIYEGTSSNKTLKVQLTVDTIPRTINSTGSALLIEVNTSIINSQLHLWLTYTFHSHN